MKQENEQNTKYEVEQISNETIDNYSSKIILIINTFLNIVDIDFTFLS